MCGSCPGGGAGSALAETIENSTAIVNVPIAIAILFLYIFSTPEFIRVGNAAFGPHARCPIAGGPVGTSSTAGRSLRVGCASGRLTASHNGVDGLSSLSLSATTSQETLHRRCRRRRGRGQDGNPAHPIERGHPASRLAVLVVPEPRGYRRWGCMSHRWRHIADRDHSCEDRWTLHDEPYV